ncbi:MAG: hypothetical protein COX66_18825 [Elusimicrobia bacterium CG_4_10_14_0_2_um_filter_63_34]|nr:MAG: hypothetical protein COX66_18825 [Elusimicrobia bacterium CG_4_10_14_0_2_um_filter_63_34]
MAITTYTVTLSTSATYDPGDSENVARSTVALGDPAFATVTGLAGNTTYYLFVEALDHGGLSSATALMGSAQTLVAPATSPLIGDSTFTAVYVSSVSIQWGDNGNNALTQYSAEASTSAAFSGAGVSVFSSGWASSTNTVFLSVSTNAVHHFRVKARNGAGVETEYFSLGSTTTLADAPGIPGSPFLFVGKSSVSASWTQATNPAGTEFKLEASTDAAFNPVLSESGWSTALSAEITGLLGESTYYFRAAARNLSGVLSAYADLGSTITALSPPAAPIVADRAPRSMRLDFSGDGNRGGETIPAWSAATALPAARHAHASAISGGRLYAAGGVVSGTPSAEVWRADILNNGTLGAWTAMTPLPAARESHALLAWGGRLYAIGGFEGAAKADVYWTTLDSNGNVGEWTAAQPLPGARYRHGAAVHNGFLYVFGGDNGVFPQSSVYSAAIGADGTLGSWSAQTALPSARAGHAVAVSSGRVFISGGLGAGLETTVWRADLSGGAVSAWTVETPLPQGRFRHAAAASRERLYAIGGFDGSTARGEVFVASVSANGTVGQWAQTGALSTGRFMHSAAFDGPRLFAIGGSDGASAFSSVEASSWTGTQYLGEAATDAGFTAVVSSRDWSPGTSIELVGLIPNTTYYVRARARGSAGGETANLAFGEILTPAARPESAASTFTVVETSSITAAYASAGNAAGTEYQLELSTASDFTGVPALSGWSTTVSTTVDGLISNTSYYLRVQARGWDKLPSPFTPLGSTWTLAAVPFGETISNVQTGGFSLSWNGAGNPGWTLFEAEVSTTAGFSAIAASSATQETSAVFAGLISASTYYARVRAFNGGGTPSTYTAVASTFTGVDAVAPGRILSPAAYQSGASGGLSIEIPVSGDDGYAGDLVAGSRFFVQWSTADPAGVSWSTASAQIQTSTGPIVAGSTSYIELTGIPVSTNAALRVWVEDEAGNYSAPSDTFTAYSSPFAFARVSAAGVSIATETALALDGQDRLVVLYANGASLLRTYDSGVWSGAETADSGGSGGFSALALDGGGGVHIVGQGSVRYSSRTASGPWNSATAFAGGEGHASVAVDGGAAQIVYNDGSAGAHTLRHGRYEGGIWQTSVVDAGAAQVGRYPRLALDGSGSGRVSYSDTSNGNLKFASWDGSAWNTFTVAATGSGDARSSLAIDAEDGSHIAFRDNATGELKFASAAVPGIWNAVEIDAGDMDLPALALDGSGRPHIAYVDAARGDLKYATHDGVKWSTQTVDSLGSVSGGPDIVVTGTGGIWISYRGANGELKAASWAAGVSGAIGGNAHGRGRAPRALAGTAASATSIQWTWLDNAANELGYRLYGSEISTGPYTLLADTATITAVTGKGTLASFVESGLTANATYYRFVAAVNAGGVSISSLAAAYPFSSVDGTPPSIVVNQAGDTVWRSSNSGLYDVDFSDVGGSGLDYFKVKASTVAGGAGPDLIAFTAVELAIGSNTYTADWSLPTTVWNVLLEGATNYITIEAADGLANAATQVDAFFVLKDTTPPVLIDNQSGDDVVRGSAGTVYDLDARDTGSGFSAFEYSASLIPASADASLIAWTSLGAGLGTTNFLSDWQVDFASLASGVTNYISVRAFDRTGSSTTIVDAFYILKDVDPSSVGITVPTDTYRSSLATLSGTASDPSGVGGVEVSVRRDPPSGLYWNGAGFLSVSRVWIAASGTATWTLSPGIPWQDAVAYEIVARSSDTLGNFAVAYATASFTLDASSPSASVSVPTPLATIGALALISGTASDGGAGVSAVEVNLRRNRDGLWWDFSTETWGAVPVSSVTAGTGTWSLTPSAVLQANLEHQTSYFIAVVARDLAVPSLANAFLSVGSTFTFSDTTPPSAITTLSALTGASPGEIELSWTAPGDDADAGTILLGEYRIHYSTVAGTVFSSASAQISISTALASPGRLERYTAGELLSGTTYYLRVFARDDADNWSAISNGATAYALNQPDTTIRGHVMKVSSEGITGVLIEAYDGGNVLLASANSVADGSGTFTLNALPVSAVQTVKVSWIAEEITSSVWLDGIPTGTGGVDFFLEIDYTLAELTGTLGTLAETSASPSGFLLAAKQTNFKQSEIELFQRSRRIATVGVDPAGRWRIGNLLPGKYGVRAFNGFEYTKLQEVELLEGEVKDVSFVFDPLPEGEVFAFPNPARRSTTVRFRSSLPGLEAEIRIFDLAGSLVRQIPGSQMTSTAPGLYHAVWDLKNMNGENAASGVYLFIVKVKGSNGQSAKVVKKLAVVK